MNDIFDCLIWATPHPLTCTVDMNFLDTYGITGTGTSTPPTSARQSEQSLNEEVSQVIGQLGRFWGGFRKQVYTNLSFLSEHALRMTVHQ